MPISFRNACLCYLHLVPALQPPLTCHSSSSTGVHSKPWMLDALRFAIHIRRGDVVTDGWTERILSTQYYINLAKAVTQVRC
jgi:hypothetical protein